MQTNGTLTGLIVLKKTIGRHSPYLTFPNPGLPLRSEILSILPPPIMRKDRTLVLCFDGTSNEFDETVSGMCLGAIPE